MGDGRLEVTHLGPWEWEVRLNGVQLAWFFKESNARRLAMRIILAHQHNKSDNVIQFKTGA